MNVEHFLPVSVVEPFLIEEKSIKNHKMKTFVKPKLQLIYVMKTVEVGWGGGGGGFGVMGGGQGGGISEYVGWTWVGLLCKILSIIYETTEVLPIVFILSIDPSVLYTARGL